MKKMSDDEMTEFKGRKRKRKKRKKNVETNPIKAESSDIQMPNKFPFNYYPKEYFTTRSAFFSFKVHAEHIIDRTGFSVVWRTRA